MRLICDLVYKDQCATRFECLGHFFQHRGIYLWWQQVGNMEVESYIIHTCKVAGEIILHDVCAEKTYTVRHASIQSSTFTRFDAWLNIHDSSLQLGMFAAEKHTICCVRTPNIKQLLYLPR